MDNTPVTHTGKTGPRSTSKAPGNTMKLARVSPENYEFYVPLGGRIRSLRVDHGLTQTELGKKLGVSLNRINDIENGYTKLNARELFTICTLLDSDPNSLMGFPK